jgi:hypothetical protein
LGNSKLVATQALDSARAYATKNKSLNDNVTVELAELGHWNDTTSQYTSGGLPSNSVRVVVAHNATSLWMSGLFGTSTYAVRARAIAWADAGVQSSSCLKPWAIPYPILMYRLMVARGRTTFPKDSLIRPFTPEDLELLRTMSVGQRTFTLKIGSGASGGTDSVVAVPTAADSTKLPGNFQAVDLPPKWLASTQAANPAWSKGNGGDTTSYKNSVSGSTCFSISVGDSLAGKTGNMVGPTINAADSSDGKEPPGVCKYIRGDKFDPASTKASDATYGDCMSGTSAGSPAGIDVKAAFYMCVTKCNGQTAYGVTMLGSFTLTKVYPGKTKYCAQNQANCTDYDAGTIQGVFNPVQDPGAVGPAASPVHKIILVECGDKRSPST